MINLILRFIFIPIIFLLYISDFQSIESKENSDTEDSRPRSEVDEDKKSDNYDSSETPKSGLINFFVFSLTVMICIKKPKNNLNILSQIL